MIALLDTNVIVRFLTGDKHPKYKKVYAFFRSIESGHIHVELKLIVLFQTLFVLVSFYKVPREAIAAALLNLLSFKGLKVKEKKIVQRTLVLWRDTKLEIVDCSLAACLQGDQQNLLYSYDRDFDRFGFNRKEP